MRFFSLAGGNRHCNWSFVSVEYVFVNVFSNLGQFSHIHKLISTLLNAQRLGLGLGLGSLQISRVRYAALSSDPGTLSYKFKLPWQLFEARR